MRGEVFFRVCHLLLNCEFNFDKENNSGDRITKSLSLRNIFHLIMLLLVRIIIKTTQTGFENARD